VASPAGSCKSPRLPGCPSWPTACTPAFGVRVDVWLVVAFALLLGSAAPLAPGAALATAVGLLFLLCRALPFGGVLLAAALVAASGARAAGCLAEFERHRTIARDELGEPRRCAGEG